MKRNRREWLRFTAGTAGLCVMLLLGSGPLGQEAGAREDADPEAIAARVATLLRSARKVVSDNQKLINDPNVADKGLTGEKVVALARQNYRDATIQANSAQTEGVAATAQMLAAKAAKLQALVERFKLEEAVGETRAVEPEPTALEVSLASVLRR